MTNTHGTLTNSHSNVKIPVTFIEETAHSFVVRIDGVPEDSQGENFFRKDAGWTFEADKPPLPTEVGSVIQITRWAGNDQVGSAWRAMLTGGGWTVAIDRAYTYSRDEFESWFQGSGYGFEVVL